MAVKKSKPAEDSAKKAPAKKSEAKPKQEVAPKMKAAKATKPVAVATATASKAETPKAPAAPKKAAAAPKKAAAPIKLSDRQLEFLKQIHGTKEGGYLLEKKAEQKTVEALLNRKLIKKGAKDKSSGNFRYTVSKAGEKHLSSIPAV